MKMSLTERLEEFAREMKDWETRKTSVVGVEIAKLPKKGDKVNLALKIIPTDENGKPLKRKGIFLTSFDQWKALKTILADERAEELIKAIDEIRKQQETDEKAEEGENEEVFEL